MFMVEPTYVEKVVAASLYDALLKDQSLRGFYNDCLLPYFSWLDMLSLWLLNSASNCEW